MGFKSDIEIAQEYRMEDIRSIAARAGVDEPYLELYGNYKAKIDSRLLRESRRPDGKLVLVTAINPTPAGEGKTTTTVGLADGLRRIGKNALVALREPSLGPVFGVKGGAALDAEHGAQRGLPQGHQGVFPNAPQAVGQTHRGGGLALAGRGGIDGGHQDQLAVGPPALPQEAGVDLGLVVAVELQVRLVHARPGGDGADVLHPVLLRDLNVAFEPHAFSS